MAAAIAPFYVKSMSNQLVPAKFLTDAQGNPIVNPNSTPNTINSRDNQYYTADGTLIDNANPNNYLVAPYNYSLQNAIDFASDVQWVDTVAPGGGLPMMISGFWGTSSQNIQRAYLNADGTMTYGGSDVPMFQDAASFHLGMVAQLSGYGAAAAQIGGSIYDIGAQIMSPLSGPALWANNFRNMNSIGGGATYVTSQNLTTAGSASLGSATIDSGTSGNTAAAAALAADIYPAPSSAGARSALSEAIARQLNGLSGTFQITKGSGGTFAISGSNGARAFININADLSGIRTTPTDSGGSYVQTSFDSNGDLQTTLTHRVSSSMDGVGNVTKTVQEVVIDSSGHQLTSTSQTQQFNSKGTLTGETDLNADGSQWRIAFNSDGSITETSLNAAGQETASYLINADGSQTNSTFNSDGSETIVTLSSTGQETESKQINADGSFADSVYDSTTGALMKIDSYVNGVQVGEVLPHYDGGKIVSYTVNGTGNSIVANGVGIFMGNGAQTTLFGSGDTIGSSAATPGTVTFVSSNATVNMDNTNLVLAGTGNVVTANSTNLTLRAGVGVTVKGGTNIANATIYAGAGNAVTAALPFVTIHATSDAAGRYTSDGEATGITLASNVVTATVVGSGNAITTAGVEKLEASGDTIVLAGSGTTTYGTGTTIVGTGNTINAAKGAAFWLDDSDHQNPNGTAQAGDSVKGDNLTFQDNTDDPLALQGTGDVVTTSGITLTLADSISVTVKGNNDTLNAGAGNAITVASDDRFSDPSAHTFTINASGLSNGTANDGQDSGITLGQNVSATVVGTKDAIIATGGDVLTASGAKITLTGDGTMISGDGNVITATGISVMNIYGTNNVLKGGKDTIGAIGTRDGSTSQSLTLEGSGYVITGSGDSFALATGASATVTGTGSKITAAAGTSVTLDYTPNGLSAAPNIIYANGGVAITLNTRASANVYGSGNTITAAGGNGLSVTNSTVALTGSDTAVSGDNNTLRAADGLSLYLGGNGVSVFGNNETVGSGGSTFTLDGTGDIVGTSSSTVTLLSGESATFNNYGGNTINATARDSLTINDDTSTYGADVINAVNVAAGSVTADGKATGITLGAQVQATVVGSGNTITAVGNNVITASNDTLLANNVTLTLSGSGDTIVGNGNTLTFGADAKNIQIKGSGESLVLSDPKSTAASLKASAGGNGNDLVLTDTATEFQITLDGMLSQSGAGAKQLTLADGTVLSAAQLANMATTGTSSNDTLYGWQAGGNVFDGKGGNDLAIGHGNGDTFVFNRGYGQLEINESDPSSAPHNVLKLGAGITESSVVLSTQNSGDLLLTDGVPSDQIKLDGMLTSVHAGVQAVQFADGTMWTRSQLLSMPIHGNGSPKAMQTLNGTLGNDVSHSTLNTHMNQLIQAMATFSPSHAGFSPTTPLNPPMTETTLLATPNSHWHR